MASETPQSLDAEIAGWARRQQGNITLAQLRGAGLSDRMIAWRRKRGQLYRVHRGVYAVGRPPSTPLERASAAVLACGLDAALSHEGALALWGFTKDWPAAFDVVVVTGDRRPQGITTHRYTGFKRQDLRVQLGIRATSPARTLLDCAPRLTTKARTRTVHDALHTPFVTRTRLADVCARFSTHPGARLLNACLDGNPTRSDFELDFVDFCARHDLPRPLINTRVAGREVDALFAQHRLIVEIDSWEFHRDREAFEADRERDANAMKAGYRTLRITWDRLHRRADAEAARLREMLA